MTRRQALQPALKLVSQTRNLFGDRAARSGSMTASILSPVILAQVGNRMNPGCQSDPGCPAGHSRRVLDTGESAASITSVVGHGATKVRAISGERGPVRLQEPLGKGPRPQQARLPWSVKTGRLCCCQATSVAHGQTLSRLVATHVVRQPQRRGHGRIERPYATGASSAPEVASPASSRSATPPAERRFKRSNPASTRSTRRCSGSARLAAQNAGGVRPPHDLVAIYSRASAGETMIAQPHEIRASTAARRAT